GMDRPGADLLTLVTGSAAACQKECVSHDACLAFTWVKSTGNCYLKDAIPPWYPCPACTSGIAPREEPGIDRPGNDFAVIDLVETRSELCHAACARASGCAGYTFVPAGIQAANARCWLKQGYPTNDTPSSSNTSGYRRVEEYSYDRPGFDYSNFS